MDTGEVWALRQGDVLLGEVTIDEIDFPWLHGAWVAADAFATVAPLFAEERRLSEDDEDGDEWGEWDEQWRRIWRSGVRLHYPDGGVVPEFLIHIEVDRAWFRWADESFAEGGVADAAG